MKTKFCVKSFWTRVRKGYQRRKRKKHKRYENIFEGEKETLVGYRINIVKWGKRNKYVYIFILGVE